MIYDKKFLLMAIKEGLKGMKKGHGGPFGCVITKGDKVIAKGHNRVTSKNDCTLHAEVDAIRKACKKLKSFQLTGCTIYASCEPCPMCLGAIYWARPDAIIFASSRFDAAEIGFDDEFIYREIKAPHSIRHIPTIQLDMQEAKGLFKSWKDKQDKIEY